MHKLYGLSAAAIQTRKWQLLFAFLFISLGVFASDDQHSLPIPLEDRVEGADMVIEGEVVSQQSFWDTRQKNIYTSNIIRVYKSFKGNVESQQIEVITRGGTVGLKKHVISTALQLRLGQQGVFFLKRQQQLPSSPGNQHISTMAYGRQQGFLKYDLANKNNVFVFDSYKSIQDLYQSITKITGQSYRTISVNEALKEKPDVEQRKQQTQGAKLLPVITSILPTTVSAGTGVELTINGSGFGATRGDGAVEFKDADDGGKTYVQPFPSDYIFWSDRQIRLYVPSASLEGGTPGSGPVRVVTNDGSIVTSETPIIVEFAYSNVTFDEKTFRPKLVDRNGEGGYTIQFAPSLLNRLPARAGFERALATWVCASGVNWKIGEPTTIEEAEEDGENVIQFAPQSDLDDDLDDEFTTLASTISYYEGCIVGGVDTVWYLAEFDMAINRSISWEYGPGPPASGQSDFETVMLHELGHAHQLGHVILPSAIMHFAVQGGSVIRDLSAADVVGANLVIENSISESVCGIPPMVLNAEGECGVIGTLIVYPNPVNEENNTVTLLYNVEGAATLNAQLYDMAGRLVRDFDITFRGTEPLVELDVSELAGGIYILKWQQRDNSGQVKLLKR